MEFSRQGYWSGLPFPSPGTLIAGINLKRRDRIVSKKKHSNTLLPFLHAWTNLFIFFDVVQSLSHVRLFVTLWTAACQVSHSFTSSLTLLNSCPLSWWCHPTISAFVVPFSYCPQSFPASESFPMSWIFALGGQNIGASTSVLHFLTLSHFVWISESQRKCWVTIGNGGHFYLVLIFWNAFVFGQ